MRISTCAFSPLHETDVVIFLHFRKSVHLKFSSASREIGESELTHEKLPQLPHPFLFYCMEGYQCNEPELNVKTGPILMHGDYLYDLEQCCTVFSK